MMECMEVLKIERWEALGQFNKINLASNPNQRIINIYMLRTVMTTSINALLMFGKVMEIIFNQIPIDLS